jgi:hypothetical protein
MGQHFPITYTSFSSKRYNTLLQWAYELNHSSVASENWHLKGHMLKIGNSIWSFLHPCIQFVAYVLHHEPLSLYCLPKCICGDTHTHKQTNKQTEVHVSGHCARQRLDSHDKLWWHFTSIIENFNFLRYDTQTN